MSIYKSFLFTYITKIEILGIRERVEEVEYIVITGETVENAIDIFNNLNIKNVGYDVYEFLDIPIYSTNERKQKDLTEYWNSKL